VARKRQELRPNRDTGNYERLLGWKRNGEDSKPRQHKFYLGKERIAATIANERLEKLWAIVEKEAGDGPALWDWLTLEIGKAIAKGRTEFEVIRLSHMPPHNYVGEVQQIARRFPILACVPADPDYFAQGVEILARFSADSMVGARATIQREAENLKLLNAPLPASGDTLHAALDEYSKHIRRTVLTPPVEGEDQTTRPYGHTQIKSNGRFKERHQDRQLASINLGAIQDMIDVWRNRPIVKGKTKPIAHKVAVEHIKQLVNFFKWLHKCDGYEWRKPDDFADLTTVVPRNTRESAALASTLQVTTYDLEEIILLYRYATPLERLLLLLGLNCGFGAGEIATLRVGEVRLHIKHPQASKIRFESTSADSFIMRIRQKTGVYGEWLLWPETVDALEWAINRRRSQSRIRRGPSKGKDISMRSDSILLLSEDGLPLVKHTVKGNQSNRIANMWRTGLTNRIRKDHPSFRQLSFNKLRKTGGDLIRHEADGEINAVFLTHGQPVKSDDLSDEYTNRPFGKVFQAIRAVRLYLNSAFDFQPTWPADRKKGGPNISVAKAERIRKLRSQGFKVREIAKKVGVSPSTIYRQAPSDSEGVAIDDPIHSSP